MLADLRGGHILAGLTGISEFIPHHKSGAIRMLAISGPSRLHQFPEVPTFTESGLTGFEERTFMGLLAPAGTPPAILANDRAAVKKVVESKAFRDAMDGLGLEAYYGDEKDLARRAQETRDTWGAVIRSTGFVPQ